MRSSTGLMSKRSKVHDCKKHRNLMRVSYYDANEKVLCQENGRLRRDRIGEEPVIISRPESSAETRGNRWNGVKARGYFLLMLLICRDLRSQKSLALSTYSEREPCSWSLLFILIRLALSPVRLFNLTSLFKSSSPEIVFFSRIFTPLQIAETTSP